MAAMPNPGLLHVRPALTRSRSNTSPITPSNLSIETIATPHQEPSRPGHNRSKSYISPPKAKLNQSDIPPTPLERSQESSRFPRLHLPGRSGHGQNDDYKPPHRRHRFMQSESQQYRKNDLSKVPEAPSPSSAAGSHQQSITPDMMYPSSRGAAIPSLIRMRSSRTYREPTQTKDGNVIGNLANSRGRANSDPKSPTNQDDDPSRSKNDSIEAQLRKGDILRYAAHQNATREDIDHLDAELKQATTELSARLEADANTASDLMQRLDQAHDTLHRTAESLVDTLSSFSSLSQQSTKLLSNFETETTNLDSTLRQRIQKFSNDITKRRAQRVSGLERRGQAISEKAGDLGRRLENCRTIVKNWEAREMQKRKTWKGVRDGILWSLMLIMIGVLAGVLSWKAVQFNDDNGTPRQALGRILKNESWDPNSLVGVNVPEDVRLVLQDIVERDRTRAGRGHGMRGGGRPQTDAMESVKEDQRVRLLDEL